MVNPESDTSLEAMVVEYLSQHPDFFVTHRSLLAELNLPHGSGKTVSLVERQVGILRERNMEMRRRTNQLMQTARTNDNLFTKIRTLSLALVEARNLQDINEVLATHILVDFEADFVTCHIVHEQPGKQGALDHFQFHDEFAPCASLVTNNQPTCLSLREHELEELFPASLHEHPGSAILLPLNLATADGFLSIGSRDTARFSQDMDTLFVAYVADILSAMLEKYLS